VLAAIAGFFFLLFLAVELLVFGVLPLNSIVVAILPLAGIVVGIIWAVWAPLGPRRPPAGWRERSEDAGPG
jgi:hypothetical protein